MTGCNIWSTTSRPSSGYVLASVPASCIALVHHNRLTARMRQDHKLFCRSALSTRKQAQHWPQRAMLRKFWGSKDDLLQTTMFVNAQARCLRRSVMLKRLSEHWTAQRACSLWSVSCIGDIGCLVSHAGYMRRIGNFDQFEIILITDGRIHN